MDKNLHGTASNLPRYDVVDCNCVTQLCIPCKIAALRNNLYSDNTVVESRNACMHFARGNLHVHRISKARLNKYPDRGATLRGDGPGQLLRKLLTADRFKYYIPMLFGAVWGGQVR
jgi:hypothetical protein